MGLSVRWNRSRATALGVTLLLHAALVAWLLALRFDLPATLLPQPDLLWLPAPVTQPAPPEAIPESLPPPFEYAGTQPEPDPEETEAVIVAPPTYDFSRSARDVAGAFGGGPARRQFGETPQAPPTRPQEVLPPSIWPKPLPRVGTTVTTPEGETILWVSDNCYISLYSRSVTMEDLHRGRQGVRMCQIGAGRKEVRDDLFESIERPPKPQEPGCNREGIGLSCAR